jgi:hypothetical protein
MDSAQAVARRKLKPMLQSILLAVVFATIVTGLAAWRLRAAAFRALPASSFTVGAAVFWGAFAALVIAYGWSSYYVHFVPPWYRYIGPIGAIVIYPLLAHTIRWASLRVPGNPALNFCVLGGLEAIPEHAVGIYRFRILDVPLLQGTSPVEVFVFAYFEYVVYWGLALGMVVLANAVITRLRFTSSTGPT